MTHSWYWRRRLPERHGQLCRVLARGALNSILVEFADGWRVVTSRYAVRQLRPAPQLIPPDQDIAAFIVRRLERQIDEAFSAALAVGRFE